MLLPSIRDRNIRAVYVAIFLVGIAYGVYVSLLAIHLDALGLSKPQIGSLAAWFASGIIALSIPMGPLLRRVRARTVLTASLLGYAVCAGVFPALRGYPALAAARFLDGAFSVGVWVSCETILLLRAPRGEKARVTSYYAIAIAIGYVIGPVAAKLIVLASSEGRAFMASSVLALVAALVAAVRLEPDRCPSEPPAEEGSERRVRGRVLWRIKTSCFATFAYGYFQASVVLFLPLYLIESKHIAPDRTILIPAFFAAGMLLFSSAAARLGDRLGHLRIMRALAAVGLTMILGFLALETFGPMCAAVFVAGATLASISPVSLALQGVVTAPEDLPSANALYNFFYAAGMLLGPPVSSLIYGAVGGGAMLVHLAALWGAFIAFAFAFAGDDPAARASTLVPDGRTAP